MHDDDLICTCMSVSVRDLKQAIASGANTFQEIQDKTGISTVCGVCNDDAKIAIDILLRENNKDK